MVNLTNFLKSEDGAVTVDWVVLCAAIIGLAILVVTTIITGATDVSTGLGASLNNSELPNSELPVF